MKKTALTVIDLIDERGYELYEGDYRIAGVRPTDDMWTVYYFKNRGLESDGKQRYLHTATRKDAFDYICEEFGHTLKGDWQ